MQTLPPYDKPPLTLDAQARRLIDLGLRGATAGELAAFLATVSYCRLRGYACRYQRADGTFLPGASWEEILEDYRFDGRLRELLFAAASRVEVPLRTQLAYQMSIAHGPWWYLDERLPHDLRLWREGRDKLLADWRHSQEALVKRHRARYADDPPPPAWKIFEIATFGALTRYYGNLKLSDPGMKGVAAFVGLPHKVLVSWLFHLNIVRNVCAHHGRLFSAPLPKEPKYPSPRHAGELFRGGAWRSPARVGTTLAVLAALLKHCRPEYPFGRLAGELLRGAAPRHLQEMGLPPDWPEEPVFAGW